MTFLSRLLPDKTPPPVPRHDPTLGYPPARQVQMAARKGDWRSVAEIFRREKDPSCRGLLVGVAADVEESEKWLDEWTAQQPQNGEAWLMSGRRWAMRGMAARGSGKATDVKEDAWDPFYDALRHSDEQLEKASALLPTDPLPWMYRLSVSMLFGDDLSQRQGFYEEGKRLAPNYGGLHLVAVYAVTEKWGGSHELMFDVARQAMAAAPATGTVVPLAVAFAHVERWLYIWAFDEDQKGAEAYFRSRDVIKELHAAWERCGGAQGPAAITASNMFAFCFWKAGEKKAAKECLKIANGVVDTNNFPWCYGGMAHYKKANAECW